jgi:hypothetical protein
MTTTDEDKPDAWVMITEDDGKKWIGGFRAPPVDAREEDASADGRSDEPIDVFEVWEDFHSMELCPCFEYVNILGKQGDDQLVRRMNAAPYDATDGDVSVHFRCNQIKQVLVLDELDAEGSRIAYDAIMQKGLAAAKAQRDAFAKMRGGR